VELPRERSSYYAAAEPIGRARLVPLRDADALIPPVYERVAIATPGMFGRTPEWWQARVLSDPEARRGGAGELMCLVLDWDGRPVAYALYRMNWGSDRGVPTGAVDVIEALGDSPASTHAIWRCLLDMDWTARIKARLLPTDHPLLLLLAEPRRLRFNFRDGLWVRLVDVGAALAARSFVEPGRVVIEVVDEFCPWNAGRWRLSAGLAGATCERTQDPADLALTSTDLGAAYLGGTSLHTLAAAGRVQQVRPGALRAAAAAFAVERPPWCPEVF
jgi:predicted acetyltransferase